MELTRNIAELLPEFDLGIFMTQNKQKTGASFLLQSKGNINPLNALLADQINLYPKALSKIPTFIQRGCWLSPKSYEQCSGEVSAKFKSTLISGKNLLDLSGGLGVDDWALSTVFDSIVSLDPDERLNVLVRENNRLLGIEKKVKRITISAENFLLQNSDKFDAIYLDADRRPDKLKDFTLAGASPNYLALESQLLSLGKVISLKVSPMADLSYLKTQLKFLRQLWLVGVGSELKEILCIIEPNNPENMPEIFVALPEHDYVYPKTILSNLIPGKQYLLEPHAAFSKGRLNKNLLAGMGADGGDDQFNLGLSLNSPQFSREEL